MVYIRFTSGLHLAGSMASPGGSPMAVKVSASPPESVAVICKDGASFTKLVWPWVSPGSLARH